MDDDVVVQKGRVGLLALFGAFFRVGLTAFGGPAMIPHVRSMVVQRYAWLSEQNFRQGMAVCQMIPGATVMQIAAYTGLRVRGLAGALSAFMGFGVPALVLITVLSALYFRHQDVDWILATFGGLQVLVVAIITSAALDFVRTYTTSWLDALIGLAAAGAILLHVHPALIIIVAMLLGLYVYRGRVMTAEATPTCLAIREKWAFGRLCGILSVVLGLLWVFAPELFALMVRMMRVDLFAFGGGFAALPMMLHEVVLNAGWMSEKTFMDGIALGQITPGPIVITSAFVGYAVHGLTGAAVAALGIFSPSMLILVWAVPHCDRLLGSAHFRRAMRASLATLGGLMAATAVTLALPLSWSLGSGVLGLTAFVALRRKIDVLWVVLVGTGASVLMV